MYSQLTTGSKTHVISKIKSDSSAVHVDLGLDTRKNKATKSNEIRDVWFEDGEEVVSGLKIKNRDEGKISARKTIRTPISPYDEYCKSSRYNPTNRA